VVKKKAATTKKPTPSEFNISKDTKAAPPKMKINHDLGTALLDASQYDRIRRNLFCQPEQDDDHDFHINFHPPNAIGYEGADVPFYIPEVSIN
jgi:hypothetical protein